MRAPISRRIASRFVAGETLDAAIAATRAANDSGLLVTLDYLGESVSNEAEAGAATEVIVSTLDRIASEGVNSNVSLKPTQLGYDIDPSFFRENVNHVLSHARSLSDDAGEIFVRLDMESSGYVEGTIAAVEELWRSGYRNVGTVLQTYLRRTLDDVERLIALGSRIRLVKGAYKEPEEVAFPEKATVDRMFVEGMQTLLNRGNYPAIATHDEAMISATCDWAEKRAISKDSFEFQMLYGVRRDLQRRLRDEGYNVRVYIPFGDAWYPYLMRRMAERPANLFFITSSIVKESTSERNGKKR